MNLGHTVILGAGISGRAAALLARAKGAGRIDIYDDAPADKLSSVRQELSQSGIEVHCSDEVAVLTAFPPCDVIVFSPGIALSSPLGVLARKSGARLMGELSFAAQFCDLPIYAVTGTNGKTTTTELFTACLNAAGHRTVSGGNIGLPLSQIVLDGLSELDCIVTEVSSFQMELPEGFSPSLALLLNITPDHLNRHGSFEAYCEAKLHCISQLRPHGHAIFNAALRDMVSLPKGVSATRFWTEDSGDMAVAGDLIVTPSAIIRAGDSTPLLHAEQIQLRGFHNLQNVSAVVCAMSALGISLERYRPVLASFKAGHHRIEFIGELNGVRFFDDSKATDVDAMIQALETLGNPKAANIHLIAGGLDKGCSLTEAETPLSVYVKDVSLIGQCKGRLHEKWRAFTPCHICDSMEDAVQQAFANAQSGDIVLLSPGCASMDMFTNYEERGLAFQHATISLVPKSTQRP